MADDATIMDCCSRYHLETEEAHPDKLVELLKSKLLEGNILQEDLDDGLFLAAVKNYLECGAILLEYGANIESRRNGRDDIFSNLDLESDFFFCRNLTPLMMASRMGHIKFVKFLIDNGADVSSFDSFGKTALMIAIDNNQEDCARFLVDNDLAFEKSDVMGYTPLHLAAKHGLCSLVKLLVSKGCSINYLNKFQYGALHSAAANGHTDIVKWLIENGAATNIKNSDGCNPLLISLLNGHEETALYLVEQTVDLESVDRNGDTALICSARKGLKIPLESLIEKGADVNVQNNFNHRPIELSVHFRHEKIALCLVENGADINFKDDASKSLVVSCILTKQIDLAKYLIEKDCLLDGALVAAARAGEMEIIRIILDKECDTNYDENRNAALHVAATLGYVEIADMLIEEDVDVDALNEDGLTPLMLAIQHGKKNIVNLLVREGCDLDIQASKGDQDCALGVAAIFGRPATIKLLVENGADMNLKNKDKCVPLYLAIENDQNKSAIILIENNCQLDVVNNGFQTVLACAVGKGSLIITKALVQHGCDINLQSGLEKLCPLHLALYCNHVDIAKYLIESEADVKIQDKCGNNALVHLIKNLVKMVIFNPNVPHCVSAEVEETLGVLKLLISRGCPVNEQNELKECVLHFTGRCHAEVLKILLQSGADANLRNRRGETALFTTLRCGSLYHFEQMLQYGADPNIMSFHGFYISDIKPSHIFPFCKLMIRYGLRTDLYPKHSVYPGLLMNHLMYTAIDEYPDDLIVKNIAFLSGSASQEILYCLLKDPSMVNTWEINPDKREWLESACSTPMTLLNLSRIIILKNVNQKPTKVTNINELKLPQSFKDFLNFSDIEYEAL